MKKRAIFLLTLVCLIAGVTSAQQITIHGKVKNSTTNETVPAVSVIVKGGNAGTFTDDKGNFKLTAEHALPVILIFSSVGYETQELTVTNVATPLIIAFKPTVTLGTDIVIAASRLPERILESPVSIERVGIAAIRNTPAPDYYDIIKTLKGVDFTSSSLTFTSLTTRGFNQSGNPRFNQFIDGMDNQAPGLNFSVGSIVGPNQLDVESMELLPGASSALYGSGGMTGTLLINSKDPFKYQGLSFELKEGMMHFGSNDPIGPSAYYNWALRWGYKVNDKFAFKIGVNYTQAQDWIASDSSNYAGLGNQGYPTTGTRASDPNYNGVNIYGDETSLNIVGSTTPFLQGAGAAYVSANPGAASAVNAILATDTLNPLNVSRTGYKETAIINSQTDILKLNGGLYYKLTPQTELSLIGNYGTGNTVYTGADRYSLKDLKMGQYKLEVKNDYWFLKAYTTQENSGNSYNATVAAQLFNEAWKPSYNPGNPLASWYPQYAGAYLQYRLLGETPSMANVSARAFADIGMPVPGTVGFDTLFNKVVSKPIPVGAKFLDRTSLYHIEGQYNFTRYIKWAEVIAGSSYRIYRLNSQGTIFADTSGPINTGEFGAYIQIAKKFMDDKLKITASGRYDKNQNFKGKFTPRLAAVYKVGADQFIRASYQNAYHFPTNQNQWINLNTGAGILLGGLPQLRDFYHIDNGTTPTANSLYTPASAYAYSISGNPAVLVPVVFGEYKPESVNSYELGYKAVFKKKFLVDAYIYYSSYTNFLGRVQGIQLSTSQGFSVAVNSTSKVSTYGAGISGSYLLPRNFELDGNFSTDNINSPDSNFVTYWSTPKYRFNIGVSNNGFGPKKLFGFNVQYRWQDQFYTESDFKQGPVAAFGTIDALISYKLADIHSLIKIGATNLLDHYYYSAYGNPAIGGLYYVSFAYNVF